MTGTVEVKLKLKPCPFCGGHATLVYDNQKGYQIYCDDCDIMTPENFNKEVVVNMWNRRVQGECDMKNENTIEEKYKAFIKTEKGKEWMKKCKDNAPSDANAGGFGDYLYDFYLMNYENMLCL